MTDADQDEIIAYCHKKGIVCRFGDYPEGPLVFLTTRQPGWHRGVATICNCADVGRSTLKRMIRRYEKAGFFDDHQKYIAHLLEVAREVRQPSEAS